MSPGEALVVGLIVVLIILVVAAWYWYYFTGWKSFSFKGVIPYVAGSPSSCSDSQVCVANNCTTVCESDADCPSKAKGSCSRLDSASSFGYCPPIAGKPCCPAGQTLVGGECLAVCGPNGDCADGSTCSNGVCQAGVTPSWSAGAGKDISSLRFRGCMFTVIDPNGTPHTIDVSAVLNGMTVAYRGARTKIPLKLLLDRPLNAFSFTIPGVNDRDTVPTAADAKLWENSPTTLTGTYRSI